MADIYAGIDVGGTHVRIVLYDPAKNACSPVKKVGFTKCVHPGREIEENICGLIVAAFAENDLKLSDLAGIGLSLAALFDRDKGDIVLWPNHPAWNDFPIRTFLTERFHVPVVMEDDANAAALGEQLAGAGQGYAHFAYITISTGIGCGIVLNDSLYSGPNGWAGEIGHIRMGSGSQEVCSCGAPGCFQAVASGPALLRKYLAETGRQELCSAETPSLEEVVRRAGQGDSAAISVFTEAGHKIAEMVTTLVMLLDLPLVIIGGGVAAAGDVLWLPVTAALDANLAPFKRKVQVLPSALGDRNGALGALNLIYQAVNKRVLTI